MGGLERKVAFKRALTGFSVSRSPLVAKVGCVEDKRKCHHRECSMSTVVGAFLILLILWSYLGGGWTERGHSIPRLSATSCFCS